MAESSHFTAGARRAPNFAAHKLRRMAAAGLGEVGALPLLVTRISRTEKEDPTAGLPRVAHTVADVTRGLGLEPGDEGRVQRLVGETRADFQVKGQTQRRMHARSRLIETMRESMRHVDSATRAEITRRADAFWAWRAPTDYGREPAVVVPAAELDRPLRKGPPPGYSKAPRGKGYRKKIGSKWDYWYPEQDQVAMFGDGGKVKSTGNKLADAMLRKWRANKDARKTVAEVVAAAKGAKAAGLQDALKEAAGAMTFEQARAFLKGAEKQVAQDAAAFKRAYGIDTAPTSTPAHAALRGLQAAMATHMGRPRRPEAPNPRKEATRAADALLDAGKDSPKALEAFGLTPAEARDTLAAAKKRRDDSQGSLFRGLLVVPLRR